LLQNETEFVKHIDVHPEKDCLKFPLRSATS